MKSNKFIFFAGFLGAIILISCGKTGSEFQMDQIDYAVDHRIENLDPTNVQDPYTIQILGLIYDGLVTLEGTEKLIPALAESWEASDDFTIWTFHIRRGAYFHENTEVFGEAGTREITAEDARYSFEQLVSTSSYPAFVIADAVKGVPEFQSGTSDSVSGFEVVDTYIFRVHLVQPEPSFANRITSPWYSIFPKEAFELGSEVFGNSLAIGSGPFLLERRSDTNVELVKNPRYWKETEGTIERVSIRTVDSDQVRLSELRNHNIDLMRITTELAPAMINKTDDEDIELQSQYSENFELEVFSTFDSHFLGFNTETVPPALRKAISYALNRQEIVDVITHGTAHVATGTVPMGLLGYETPYPSGLYNVTTAQQILDSAGNNAPSGALRIASINRDLGDLVQEQLAEVGIKVQVEHMSYNAVLDRMIDGSADAYLVNLIYVFSAPEVILNNIFHSSKRPVPNFFRYVNPEVDSALNKVRHVGDREQANRITREIERQIIEDAPAVFLYQPRNLIIYDTRYSNLRANGHGVLSLWDVAGQAAK